MSRYVIYTAPGSGHLYPLVPTLLALQQRGHHVTVCTERDGLPLLEGLGFTATAVHEAIEQREDDTWKAYTPVGALRRSVSMYVDRAEHEIADVRRVIEQERPDAIVVDNNCWGAAAMCEASGIPWAQAATFLLPLTTPDAPPFGLGLVPSRSLWARARDTALRRSSDVLFDPMIAPINRKRRALGVGPIRHVSDLYVRAPLVLSYTAEPLEYPRPLMPASVRMVGPSDWDPARDGEAPPWLDELTRPVVLVTVSTVFQDDAKLVQVALDALADAPFDVVATSGSVDPASFRVPANARVHRFVPHSHVLARAAAVVCHGGMGITQKALLAGVPVCIVPFGRDQLEVARRVQLSGAGTRLLPRRLTAPALRRAVTDAVALRPAAASVAQRLTAAGGAEAAADHLERLLRVPAAGPSSGGPV